MNQIAPPEPQPAIVVTGASSGIGREFARMAAGEGAYLLLTGRSQEALAELVGELTARGARAVSLPLDLADPDAGERIEAALYEHGLYCDVLVNSAGYGLYGPAAELDRAQQLSMLDVNARALTDLTLRFLPGMLARRRGGVINVGSLSGYLPGPRMALYYASKAYVRSFSDALYAELSGTGVMVTAVNPGPVRTDFFRRANAHETLLSKFVSRLDAPDVARAGWRAFKAGRREVMPGLLNRVLATGMMIMPRSVVLWLSGFLLRRKGG
jgi:short-subunit dehydrogenase